MNACLFILCIVIGNVITVLLAIGAAAVYEECDAWFSWKKESKRNASPES